MSSHRPSVAIIVINYRGLADTLECLRSLEAVEYANRSIVVVDQASDDGSAAAIRVAFPDVEVVESPVNDGFAGGNNRGAARAVATGSDYLFLLNNDTTVAPDILDLLIDYAENNPGVGVVGPLMLYADFPDVVWSAGGSVARRGDSTMLEQGRAVSADGGSNQPFAVDFVVGCGLLIKRVAWDVVGPMDEQYFLYYEEADWCVRARRAGWVSVTVPAARLWHKVSRSTGTGSHLTLYYMRRNVLRFLRSNARSRIAGVMSQIQSVLDTLYLASVWSFRGERSRASVLLWALSDYASGRMGKSTRF